MGRELPVTALEMADRPPQEDEQMEAWTAQQGVRLVA